MTKGWHEIAPLIEKIEREEAKYGLRIVNVATSATHLPAEQDGQRIHPGRFGGWIVREATFEDASLAAVVGMSDGSSVGLTVDGDVVEVIHG
ncbi:MAG TPA: hypothetical protein VFM34_05195 [Moraxellaceae bacterium]|nr:hypothetical protein [Moraxellaceae bacterium]